MVSNTHTFWKNFIFIKIIFDCTILFDTDCRYIGVVVDSNCLFSKHVERVVLQIKQKIGILEDRKVRSIHTISVWYTGVYSSSCYVLFNWSSLHKLYSKALGCMAFKWVHPLAPSLVVDKFLLHDDVTQRTTRNSNQLSSNQIVVKLSSINSHS